MRTRTRTLAVMLAFLCFASTLFAANAPHDLKVEMKATNTSGVNIGYPGPVKFQVKISNLGPVQVTDSYKIQVNKFDHTGQRWLKSVYTRDLPLLTPPNGNLPYFIVPVEDTAGNASTDSGTTFIYRASIGPGYYTDPNNANNRADVAVRFLAQQSTVTPLSWKGRLTPADFTRAGATLTEQQIQKLNNGTYSLQSIVSSSTDRLVDTQRCVYCHTGQPTQSVPYRPELGQLPITKLMNHRPTPTSEIVGGYNWQNGNSGVVAKFINRPSKPDALKKIFKLWLSDGAR